MSFKYNNPKFFQQHNCPSTGTRIIH